MILFWQVLCEKLINFVWYGGLEWMPVKGHNSVDVGSSTYIPSRVGY